MFQSQSSKDPQMLFLLLMGLSGSIIFVLFKSLSARDNDNQGSRLIICGEREGLPYIAHLSPGLGYITIKPGIEPTENNTYFGRTRHAGSCLSNTLSYPGCLLENFNQLLTSGNRGAIILGI